MIIRVKKNLIKLDDLKDFIDCYNQQTGINAKKHFLSLIRQAHDRKDVGGNLFR